MKTTAALLGLVVMASACSGGGEVDEVPLPSLPIPADWIGHGMGVHPRIELEGPARIVSDAELGKDAPIRGLERPSDDVHAEADADSSWRVVRIDTGLMYRVGFDRAELHRLAEALRARGDASGFRPDGDVAPAGDDAPAVEPPAVEPPQVPEGMQATWSNGVDSRTRRGIADGFAVNHWPYRAIGHFPGGEGCTGTLIGRRTVLTAAHCVASQGVGVGAPTFRPRSDNTQNPPQLTPYGAPKVVSVWVPWQYIDKVQCKDTGAASQIACNKYDIAVAELDADVGAVTGGFGFGVAGISTLDDWYFMMRGYPSCNASWPDRPSNCPTVSAPQRNAALWGDTVNCDIGDYWSPDGDGWSRELSVGCDASRGMSGSAWYTTDSPLNPGNPIAYGVYSQTLCIAGGCAGDLHPNDITRITPSYSDIIVALKSVWGG